MASIAKDMHGVSETMMGLNAELIEESSGYGWVKSPSRHVRTRLYFTSESHVHALVNTLKYWSLEPSGADRRHTTKRESSTELSSSKVATAALTSALSLELPTQTLSRNASSLDVAPCSPSPNSLSPSSQAESGSQPPKRLVTESGAALLEATPELDYLTHIVFRLYENFAYPVGHPKRHRVEVLASPGSSFSPVDGNPRTPRLASAKTTISSTSGTPPAGAPPLFLPPAATGAGQLSSLISQKNGLDSTPSPILSNFDVSDADAVSTSSTPPFGSKISHGPAVFSGPTRATAAEIDAHRLPVAPLLPLHTNLTLEDFEDVLAEAIYSKIGVANKAGGSSAPVERHPKEEARVRREAAVARARLGQFN
jgi:hypothetical protein